MPIYEFRCRDCSHRSEKLVRNELAISDCTCDDCGSNKLERLMSSSTFILKGGGWYADGYTKGGSNE